MNLNRHSSCAIPEETNTGRLQPLTTEYEKKEEKKKGKHSYLTNQQRELIDMHNKGNNRDPI